MDILPDSSDNLTVHEWDLITDILLNLDLGLPTNKALNLLSIPALRAFIAQSDRIIPPSLPTIPLGRVDRPRPN
jgi:hypothetical protein